MRSRLRLAVLLVAGLLIGLGGPAHAAMPEVMPVADVRPGMKGYGLSCFRGSVPERFGAEVVGVMSGYYPKSHVIYVRLDHPVVNEARVISGMSGSPVYVDGKLLGAVAYGTSFAQAPIAGLTPAEEMLRVPQMTARAPAQSPRAAAAGRVVRGVHELAAAMVDAPAAFELADPVRRALTRLRTSTREGRPTAAREAGDIWPLPVPLAVSGAHADAALALLQASGLADAGVRPVPGMLPAAAAAVSGASAAPGPADESAPPGVPADAPFVAGGPIAIALVTGDMDVAGTGTVTVADGDTVLAFGHPMMSLGDVDLPMATADVVGVMPRLEMSYRMTNSGRVVGRLVQDRDSAVMGRVGQTSPMFPCNVRITGRAADSYTYRVTGFWQMAAEMAGIAVQSSVARWQSEQSPVTLTARSELRIAGREEPLVLENVYADYSTVWPVLELVDLPLSVLMTNPFEEVQIEGLDFEMDVRDGAQAALVLSARADRAFVEPGGELNVRVALQPWRGERETRTVTVPVPEDARPGTEVELVACDAITAYMLGMTMDPGFYDPTNMDDLVRALARMPRNTELIVRAGFQTAGVRYEGAAMPDLPPSALAVLETGGSDATTPLVRDVAASVRTPWVLSGAQRLKVHVRERNAVSE